jgi:hypothetical protein
VGTDLAAKNGAYYYLRIFSAVDNPVNAVQG